MKMNLLLLLIMVTFASERKENDAENLIMVKIEEDEYKKVQKKSSQYIGVHHKDNAATWQASRWSKHEKKAVYNGCYKNEETAAHASDTLARKLMAGGKQTLKLNFPQDNTEVNARENKTSEYIGVSYIESKARWVAQRWSKKDNRPVYNGLYKDEDKAAHASDTLARQLMAGGKQKIRLNFPDDNTEVNAENKTSEYIGVSCNFNESKTRWRVSRWSKMENKAVANGSYKDEETAAHASDTLARKLMKNGEQQHKLNFPDDDTEVYPEEQAASSIYIGVSYQKKYKLWRVHRHSKHEKKMVQNGSYKDEETAAHASDTLARKLMENGEQHHKLNFPDDNTEVYPKKNTSSNYIGVSYYGNYSMWRAQRHSKNEKKKSVYNGYYKNEETAAHASDNFARKLMKNGKQNHKLNFPDDDNEVNAEENQTNKRKRSDHEDLEISQK